MNLLKFFQKSHSASGPPRPHMTWASSSLSKSASRTGAFLKKQIWVWPIIAVLLLSAVGFIVQGAIESTIKGNISSGLQLLLRLETAMLETWGEVQSSNAETLANDRQIRASIYELIADAEEAPAAGETGRIAAVQKQLRTELGPTMSSHDYVGYFVADKSKRILSASHAGLIGQQKVAEYDDFLSKALDGTTVICPPFRGVVLAENEFGLARGGEPTMFVCAPVRDEGFQVVAVLALQIDPAAEFTRILQQGRLRTSGETYAFNKTGVMVSNSRFDEDLILLGLLPDEENSDSILHLMVRDPGGDMTRGHRPGVRRGELPLTRMAESAVTGNSGVDTEGYRDYRGVQVVGAWTWLPKFDIGVTSELDVAEAYRPLVILQNTFMGLFILLFLSSVAIFVFSIVVARMHRDAQKAAIEAQQLGQYTLDEKIGSGAMGAVYKGHHSMLRRPTAIKLLDIEKVNDASIQRFEREVQITCQLNHPNTIAIYDYGRTPEGVFYYAMEYLGGIDLQALVENYGPQSEERVIHVLLQICGSLYEAHSQGLVHRDIKPANVMINRRGGEPDVVKVLDFGLVKAVDGQKQAGLTGAGSLTGTPLYMSPEAIQTPMSVDSRSDLYAVGAVGYFLRTGKTVFDATSIVELCQKHVDEVPTPPSKILGSEVSGELENALLASLEKSRANRPQTARDLAQLLKKCPAAGGWSIEDADAWWGKHERGQGQKKNKSADDAKTHSGYDRTISPDSV